MLVLILYGSAMEEDEERPLSEDTALSFAMVSVEDVSSVPERESFYLQRPPFLASSQNRLTRSSVRVIVHKLIHRPTAVATPTYCL